MITMQYTDCSVININATLSFHSIWELQLPSDTSNIENILRGR